MRDHTRRAKWRVVWITGILLPLILGVLVAYSYDDLRNRQSVVEQTASSLDEKWRARLDLTPDLVDAARTLIPENSAVFAAVAEMRTLYVAAKDTTGRLSSAANLELALSNLISLVTNDERTSEDEEVLDVVTELDATGAALTGVRDAHDAAVDAYNDSLERFPNALFATLLGFEPQIADSPRTP